MLLKNISLICCIVLITISAGMAQASLADIFDNTAPITWLGIDCSGAKFLGDREKYGSSSDIKFLISAWNNIIEREYEGKYNIGRALHKSKVQIKIDVTRAHNEELDVTEMLSNKPADYFHLKEEDMGGIINSYDFQGLSGLGLMFNVESFNKFGQQAAIWVTFIDMSTKEIILTERMLEAPGGSGLRNYWANSVAAVIEKIKKKQYEMWRRKYVRQ